MKTYQEFQRLEKVELGGIGGKNLSALVMDIFNDFNEHYKVFSDGNFDCLDTSVTVGSCKPLLPQISCFLCYLFVYLNYI